MPKKNKRSKPSQAHRLTINMDPNSTVQFYCYMKCPLKCFRPNDDPENDTRSKLSNGKIINVGKKVDLLSQLD